MKALMRSVIFSTLMTGTAIHAEAQVYKFYFRATPAAFGTTVPATGEPDKSTLPVTGQEPNDGEGGQPPIVTHPVYGGDEHPDDPDGGQPPIVVH